MATRKCRNIYIAKYFLAVRKFTNIYHIPKYFGSSVNINGRFMYTLFLVCFIYVICHHYIKKNYRPTERGIDTSYFGEIKNELFFKERAFLYKIQTTFIHVEHTTFCELYLLTMLKRKDLAMKTVQHLGRDHRPTPDPLHQIWHFSRETNRFLATLLTIWTFSFKPLYSRLEHRTSFIFYFTWFVRCRVQPQ